MSLPIHDRITLFLTPIIYLGEKVPLKIHLGSIEPYSSLVSFLVFQITIFPKI
jgi:hypothetical protein